MEMAGSEEVSVTHSHQHRKSTAGGLLAGNSHKRPGNSQKDLNLVNHDVCTAVNLTGPSNAPNITRCKPGRRN